MSDSTHIINSTDASFGDDVILKSEDTAVLIDFWAPWCGPCRMLSPILEQLAEHYQGKLIIAKVNTDENPALAQHFSIRGIPALKLIKAREVVYETTGVQPFTELQAAIDPFISAENAKPENADTESVNPQTPAERIAELELALQDDDTNVAMNLELVSTYLINDQNAKAFAHFDKLPINITESENGQKVRVLVDFYKAKEQAPDYDTLSEQLIADPMNHMARYQLGLHKLLDGYHEAALQDFMFIVQTAPDYKDGLGRKALIASFAVVDDEALIKNYRRKMASLLN